MLRLEGVSAGYASVPVIRELSLQIEEGDTIALLGPNGAGKSTLLAAITGTIPQRAGTIEFAGRNIVRLDSHRIVALGLSLVPEGRMIFGPLTVRDNLRLGALRLSRGGGRRLAERYDFIYDLFPVLKVRERQLAGTLSGGEQQMLAIGRALMLAPRVLLLDEPFTGLAPMLIEEIRRVLDALRAGGLTMLLVEQKLDIAMTFASRAYVLIKGHIVLESDAETLLKREDLGNLYFDLAGQPEKTLTKKKVSDK